MSFEGNWQFDNFVVEVVVVVFFFLINFMKKNTTFVVGLHLRFVLRAWIIWH
jgi:hypothetical protein